MNRIQKSFLPTRQPILVTKVLGSDRGYYCYENGMAISANYQLILWQIEKADVCYALRALALVPQK